MARVAGDWGGADGCRVRPSEHKRVDATTAARLALYFHAPARPGQKEIGIVLQAYRFEHPNREERFVILDGWSYLWAGLFGAFYVAAMGFRGYFVRALLIDIAYGLLFLAIVGVSFMLTPALVQIAVVALSAPVVLLLHGANMIKIVRDGYRRRGWWTTRL